MFKFLKVDMKAGRAALVDIPAEYQGLGGRAQAYREAVQLGISAVALKAR